MIEQLPAADPHLGSVHPAHHSQAGPVFELLDGPGRRPPTGHGLAHGMPGPGFHRRGQRTQASQVVQALWVQAVRAVWAAQVLWVVRVVGGAGADGRAVQALVAARAVCCAGADGRAVQAVRVGRAGQAGRVVCRAGAGGTDYL